MRSNGTCGTQGTLNAKPTMLSRFLKRESGSISVEAVLWMPIYFVFFALIIDVSNMMHSRSMAMRILQDANRHAVTGYLTEQAEVSEQIISQMQTISNSPNIDVAWTDADIITAVSYPARDAQIFGILAVFADFDLSVHSYNRFEI
jgi:hypothetical protein